MRGSVFLIGAIGSKSINDVIIFEVSDKRIATIEDFKRSNKINFSKNNVINQKPVSEYVGSELDTISFKISLKSQLGTDPRNELNKLIYLHRDGVVVTLVLFGQAFGTYRWVITSLDMDYKHINSVGYAKVIDCNITLEEYASEW